jgi:hypothetical protein
MSSPTVAADTGAILRDADRFDEWQASLRSARSGAPSTPSQADFSLIPGAGEFRAAYVAAAQNLKDFARQGDTNLGLIATWLRETVGIYEDGTTAIADIVDEIRKCILELFGG